LAILYGDKRSASAWVYEYDPDSSRSSWRDPGNLIGHFGSVSFSDPDALGHVYFDLQLDPQAVADINAYQGDPWQGLGFDPATGRLGVSSQFFSNDGNGVYNEGTDGKIVRPFAFVGETSYGRHYRTAQPAEPMPEPHAVAAFTVGLAVVGWGIARSRRSAGSGS
jgi:hypothetical protein